MVTKERKHPKILIVEDETTIRDLLARVLANQDHWQPESVTNGEDAIEAWEKESFDLILMDVVMPRMDGIETTLKIRQREKESGRKRTPIIAFTGRTSQTSSRDCSAAGMDEFLAKPTKMKDLVKTVSQYLPDYFS